MDVAEKNAGKWVGRAEDAARAVARRLVVFTADDVWDELHRRHPPELANVRERRAMGPVLMKLAKLNEIEAGTYVKSRNVANHGRPMRSWSLVRR